jgi:hypothetical protein
MATVMVTVKDDDDVKQSTDAEAAEEGGELVVKKASKVVGHFDLNKVEYWSALDAERK